MLDSYASKHRMYRRGMMLGLSVAEVMLLVLFSLMLAMRELAGTVPDAGAAPDAGADRDAGADWVVPSDIDEVPIEWILSDGGVPPPIIARRRPESLDAGTGPKIDAIVCGVRETKGGSSNRATPQETPPTQPGRGTEHPACWSSLEQDKPEYIFDVTLAGAGLIIHDNALPHRAGDQSKLPLSGMSYDASVSPKSFLKMTGPLYEWSRRQQPECRFFVRVFDRTDAQEKALYKTLLRTVGGHFYYYEELGAVDAGAR